MLSNQSRAAKPPEGTTFYRSYPGTIDQVRRMRAEVSVFARDCPAADDLILLASELATNAILHSRSGHPDRSFGVRAMIGPGECARLEVIDEGGAWEADQHDDEHGRGLAIVSAIAGDGNWGIEGDAACRLAWCRLGWARS